MINCVHSISKSNHVLLGYTSGVIASVHLDFKCLSIGKSNEMVPDFMTFNHNAPVMCISADKNMNMFASICAENVIYIQSLTNGIFLNKISLCVALVRVNSLWLNKNGYVTLHGSILRKIDQKLIHQSVLQSVGINGDFIGKPCYINANFVNIDQDRAKIHRSEYYVNTLTGEFERWSEEDINLAASQISPSLPNNFKY